MEQNVDFIQCLEHHGEFQVVYLHVSSLNSARFYYLQGVCNGVLNFKKCDNTEFGPISVQLSGVFPVNVRVTTVQGGSSSLPPWIAYQDYLKDLEVYNKYNMSYTKYIECIIDELLENN